MKIDVSFEFLRSILANETLKAMLSEEDNASAERRLSFGSSTAITELNIGPFDVAALQTIKSMAVDNKDRGLANRIASLINLKNDPLNAKIGNLKALPGGLAAYLLKNAIKGWVFKREDDGTITPWLVTHVAYHAKSTYSPESVSITLMANTAKIGNSRDKDLNTHTLSVNAGQVYKKTIGELLDDLTLLKETADLHREYEEDLDRFIVYRQMDNKQFTVHENTLSMDDSTSRYFFSKREALKVSAGHKLVNDESLVSRFIVASNASRFWDEYSSDVKFDQVPYHCKLYFFNLNLHVQHWLHVNFIKPYEYSIGLKNKLVLPQDHHDLIEILASDMGFIMADIVAGKSGGTTILCKGAPGLGKTLTAEVYSEVIGKPLYRVHSGQLGITATAVEKSLTEVLTRAARWGAVMLIDEADVFIRKRGDDIDHNAVVAAFLRTLEYFDGLLFMTTNRQDDVDDAILSRCIAVIKYELPTQEDAKKIWKVLSEQFECPLSSQLIDELVAKFNKASGRDIKELLKLTSKFCKGKNIPVDIEAFRRCGMFRGFV